MTNRLVPEVLADGVTSSLLGEGLAVDSKLLLCPHDALLHRKAAVHHCRLPLALERLVHPSHERRGLAHPVCIFLLPCFWRVVFPLHQFDPPHDGVASHKFTITNGVILVA